MNATFSFLTPDKTTRLFAAIPTLRVVPSSSRPTTTATGSGP